MMQVYTVIPIILSLGLFGLASIYLFSKEPDRRRRAWRLLKLIFRDRT